MHAKQEKESGESETEKTGGKKVKKVEEDKKEKE
jgi:hypothetical protein